MPFMVAYIGGKKESGFAIGRLSINIMGLVLGARRSKINLSDSHLRKSNNATTIGTKIDTTTVNLRYKTFLLIVQ